VIAATRVRPLGYQIGQGAGDLHLLPIESSRIAQHCGEGCLARDVRERQRDDRAGTMRVVMKARLAIAFDSRRRNYEKAMIPSATRSTRGRA
jgi:hypothetical protein